MFRALFLLIKLAIVILIIGAISVICVVTFVDPNQYKPDISNVLEKATKRKVNIYGNLQWSLTPHISINARNISLGNIDGFDGPLLTIKDANIQIAPLELLKGKVVVNGLTVQGLAIKLTVNQDGESNLKDLTSALGSYNNSKFESELNKKISIASAQSLLFKKVKLNKVKVIYENEQNNDRWVANINASTENLVIKKYIKSLPPIRIEGEQIDISNPKYMRLQMKGSVQYLISDSILKLSDLVVHWNTIKSTINGRISINDKKSEIKVAVNIDDFNQVLQSLDLRIPEKNIKDLNLTASISTDNDEIEVNSFKIKLSQNEKYTGHINIPNEENTPISLNVETNNGSTQSIYYLYDKVLMIFERLHPVDNIIPKNKAMKARVSGFDFKLNDKYTLTSIHSKFLYQNNALKINSLSIEAINSSLQANGSIKFGDEEKAELNIKSSNLSMEDAFDILGIKNTVKGVANANIQLSANSLDFNKWPRTCKGLAEIEIEPGSFYGYSLASDLKITSSDLKSLDSYVKDQDIASIQKVTSKTISPRTNNLENKTNFNKAIINCQFDNGIYDFSKMNIIGPDFNISGEMKISLPEQKVSSKLSFETSALDDSISLDLKNVKTSIQVAGSPSSPTFLLDTTRVIKRSAWLLQRNQEQEQTRSLIEGLVNSVDENTNSTVE